MRRDYKDARTMAHYRSSSLMVDQYKYQQGNDQRLNTMGSEKEKIIYHPRAPRVTSPQAHSDTMEIQLLYKANKRDKAQGNRSSAKILAQPRTKNVSRAGEAFEEIKQQEQNKSRKILDIFKNIKQSHSVRHLKDGDDDASKSPFSKTRQEDSRAEHYKKWDRAAKLTS